MTNGVTGNTGSSDYSVFGVNKYAEEIRRKQQQLEVQLGMKKIEETDLDSSISQTTTEKNLSDSKKALLSSELQNIINTENPLNKMYSGIKQFRIDGMCGMDMGMGQADAAIDMQLTGQELLDISSLLESNNDGKYSTEDLANQLKEKGYDASAGTVHDDVNNADRDGITIKREDGTEIKLCDANGDGQLNSCDYDFSEALTKLQADLTEYEAKLDAKQAEIDEQQEVSDGLQQELDTKKGEKTKVDSDIETLNTQVFHYDQELFEARSLYDQPDSNYEGGKRLGAKNAFNGMVEQYQKDYKSMTPEQRKNRLNDMESSLNNAKFNIGGNEWFEEAEGIIQSLWATTVNSDSNTAAGNASSNAITTDTKTTNSNTNTSTTNASVSTSSSTSTSETATSSAVTGISNTADTASTTLKKTKTPIVDTE